MKPLTKPELKTVTKKTIEHYQGNAAGFWEGTRDHDVSQNYQALLEAAPTSENLSILDFGCGPGRDVLYFKSLGHQVVGLDACPAFCEMARELTGCDILQQDFLNLGLPNNTFDGVFANASLFHVPKQELTRVLEQLHACLKPDGILFSSNPRGNQEGWSANRYCNFMELEPYQTHLEQAGFDMLRHYYRPENAPRDQQPWLAVVSRKR